MKKLCINKQYFYLLFDEVIDKAILSEEDSLVECEIFSGGWMITIEFERRYGSYYDFLIILSYSVRRYQDDDFADGDFYTMEKDEVAWRVEGEFGSKVPVQEIENFKFYKNIMLQKLIRFWEKKENGEVPIPFVDFDPYDNPEEEFD